MNTRLTSIGELEQPLSVISFRETGLILTSEGTQIIMHRIEANGEIISAIPHLRDFGWIDFNNC